MGTEAVLDEPFVDVFCDLVYRDRWIDIGQEDVDQECNRALGNIGTNYPVPSTDRIQVPSASEIHCFRRHGPTYIHEHTPRHTCSGSRYDQS